MNTTPADEVILKTDVLGRVRMPAARREKLLDEFERSGVSGRKFAELIGIKYQTFATWAQKRRRARIDYPAAKAPAKATHQLRWLEAVVQEASASAPLKLHLPGGAWLEITQSDQVTFAAALVRALQPPPVSC
jgi:acetyl esterase/lipase